VSEGYIAVSDGGCDKTFGEIQSHYSWRRFAAVDLFLKRCTAFQIRKSVKQHVVSKPVVSVGVMTRLRIDLIDMRTRPDLGICVTDNGKEFIANVIVELKHLFPEMCFIRGHLRHPHSQGWAERANSVLIVALGKWMSTNNSDRCSEGLSPVVYGISTRISSVTKTTPFEVMFGQPPRSDSDFCKVVKENNVEDEDQLPIVTAEGDDGGAVDIPRPR
ncbi:unnamed protein product, partial [Didymodactylos carnosus]